MKDDNVVYLGPRRIVEQDDCRAWTPRELLQHMLKLLDAGELPVDSIVVVFTRVTPEGTLTGMRRSQASLLQTIGMLETAKHDLLEMVL
jgi:hypothetical protein